MRYRDPFEVFNRIFAEFDHSFREYEKDWGVTLPSISVPGIAYSSNTRIYSDGETEKHFLNGMLHCEDGPAVVKYNKKGEIESEEYFLEGVKKTKEEVETYRIDKEEKEEHLISLGNKRFKITGKKLKELQNKLGLEEEKQVPRLE
jgi:hypothetical protein